MRLVLDVECPVDRDVPEAEALAVLRVLTRIVRGQLVVEGEDPANGLEIMDQGHSVGTMTLGEESFQ